jgi:hypothetical protein
METEFDSLTLQRTPSAHLGIQKSLIMMGYDMELIHNVILYFDTNNIDAAIDLMSKTNGIWNHQYVKDENSDKCLICKDEIVHHKEGRKINTEKHFSIKNYEVIQTKDVNLELRKYSSMPVPKSDIKPGNSIIMEDRSSVFEESKKVEKKVTINSNELLNILQGGRSNNVSLISDPEDIKIIISEFDKKEGEEKPVNNIEEIIRRQAPWLVDKDKDAVVEVKQACSICLGDITNPFELKCKHTYCKECIVDYIVNKIKISDVDNMLCPEGNRKCKVEVEEDTIKLLVTPDNHQKFLKFKKKSDILKLGGIQCPFPDCEGFAYDIKENQFITCIFKHEFCKNCMQQAHEGINCDTKLENEFEEFVKNGQVRKCPRCGFFIQKQDGCNHMTCASCKHQFCWLCMKPYAPGHYDEMLGGCYGLQYNTNVAYFSSAARLSRRVGRLIGTFFLFILLLIAPSLIIIPRIGKKIYDKSRHIRQKKVLRVIYILFIGLMSIGLFPIFYMLVALMLWLMPLWIMILTGKYILK